MLLTDLIMRQDDVCIYVTESCNSNCVMCPMSMDARKRGDRLTKEQWERIPELIPEGTPHITITGGEPFLEYKYLIPAIKRITEVHPYSEILILTNARAISIPSVFLDLQQTITNRIRFAIPIHSADSELHDMISQSPGSFKQTMHALKNLEKTPGKIEIRIVGHRLNAIGISDTLRKLADSDLKISFINIIAMEMTGCAARNRKELWIDYQDLCRLALDGIYYAVHHGIDVGLYNFPLCTVPKELWPIVKKSITPSKIRYYPDCSFCREGHACGGLFTQHMN